MTSVQSSEPQTVSIDDKSTADLPVRITATELPTQEQIKAPEESEAAATATKILKIIEQYGLNYERTGSWDGFETFLPVVVGQVERKEPIRMLLPGFPFKSPNTKDKVLGVLPDLGEELALKHVNGIAEKIKAIYEYGAEVHVTSDGLVYNGMPRIVHVINHIANHVRSSGSLR